MKDLTPRPQERRFSVDLFTFCEYRGIAEVPETLETQTGPSGSRVSERVGWEGCQMYERCG